MNNLHETIGKNIFKETGKTLIQRNLKWNLLGCITSDGGKNTCGQKRA